MSNDAIFHAIEIVIQSGILVSMVTVIWKASAVVQDFRSVKSRQEEHIEDDKEQFAKISANLGRLQQGLARIEGRIAK